MVLSIIALQWGYSKKYFNIMKRERKISVNSIFSCQKVLSRLPRYMENLKEGG